MLKPQDRTTKSLGSQGETLAAQYLKKNGYEVIEQNYSTKLGEIDIIAKDEDTLCFVEVKARTSLDCGYPFEFVSLSKQQKLVRLAQWYLKEKNLDEQKIRFDVVSVLLFKDGKHQIDLIKDGFESGSRV